MSSSHPAFQPDPEEYAPDPEESSDQDLDTDSPDCQKLQSVFCWPQTYAEKILQSNESRDCFKDLLEVDICHNESFSGTGSAGIALHMAHDAFRRHIDKLESTKTGTLSLSAPYLYVISNTRTLFVGACYCGCVFLTVESFGRDQVCP